MSLKSTEMPLRHALGYFLYHLVYCWFTVYSEENKYISLCYTNLNKVFYIKRIPQMVKINPKIYPNASKNVPIRQV